MDTPQERGVERMIVFQDEVVESTLDVVVNGDIALCTYLSENVYMMKCVNSDGEVLWTKPIGHGMGELVDGYFQNLEKVIVDNTDNSFALFYGNRLLRIDVTGEEIYHNPTFLNLSGYEKFDVLQNKEGDFIIVGTKSQRAYVAKYSHDGQEIFRKIYFISLPGINAFTSVKEVSEGGYLLAGTHESQSSEFWNSVFIAKLTDDGEFEWMNGTELSPSQITEGELDGRNVFGRELIHMQNGNYIYVINASHYSIPNPDVKVLILNQKGDVLKKQSLNVATSNFAVGITGNLSAFSAQRNIGYGLVQNSDGSFSGLINKSRPSNLDDFNGVDELGGNPSYTYQLDTNGDLMESKYFSRLNTSYYTGIGQFENGTRIAQGTSLSFGTISKMVLIYF